MLARLPFIFAGKSVISDAGYIAIVRVAGTYIRKEPHQAIQTSKVQ
jgi:hypothetical protein